MSWGEAKGGFSTVKNTGRTYKFFSLKFIAE